MKFDLIIKDVSSTELDEIIAKLGGAPVTVSTPFSTAAHTAAAGLPTPPAPMPGTAGSLQPSPVAASDVDSDGLPWDERIHSSSKKKTAKGIWARRKNIDDSVFDQVVAELRGNATPSVSGNVPPAPGYSPVAPIPAHPTAPVSPPATTDYPMPSFLQTPPPPAPASPAAPQQAPQPQAGGQTITDLFNKVQQLFATGNATAEYINSVTTRLSQRWNVHVASINDVANRPDMIVDAFALIAADGK